MAGPYQVILTVSGEKDLLDILRSIEVEFSHAAAVKVHGKILDSLEKLEVMPSAYAVYRKLKSKNGFIYRRIQAGKYYVVFRIEEVDAAVFVIMIHHIRRGDEFLKKELP